jgi:hypothetical protein
VQEPEGSSPHSQQLATSLYHEPVESNPHPQSIFLRSILIPSSHLRLGLSFWLSHQNLVQFSFLPCGPHIPPTSFASTWSGDSNKLWSSTETTFVVKHNLKAGPSARSIFAANTIYKDINIFNEDLYFTNGLLLLACSYRLYLLFFAHILCGAILYILRFYVISWSFTSLILFY